MNKPSKSPDRYSFQKSKSLQRWAEQGRTPENDEHVKTMLEFYNSWGIRAEENETNPAWQKNNLEYDLRTCDWILEKVRNEEHYAQNLYAAICNNEFQKRDLWPMLKDETWSASWRYAGGIIADMRQEGDYIDWYCSGMGGLAGGWQTDEETFIEWSARTKFVSEGVVTEEIQNDLFKLGWIVVDDKNNT